MEKRTREGAQDLNADEETTAGKPNEDKQFGGRTLSREELMELANQYPSAVPPFPDSNGSEIACLTEDGTIEILHSSTANNTNSQGTQSFAPGDKNYDYYWKRHGFDNPQGKNHAILKKWTGAEWIDHGDHWY